MNSNRISTLLTIAALAAVSAPRTASAIPSFARKYETSCQTCHTIYPRLNPFGEAFRRNGYRFPGNDSDMTKMPMVPMGQEAYKDVFPDAVWPDSIGGNMPLSMQINGGVVLHPDTKATGAVADNGTLFNMKDLVAEAHLFAGGTFDETISYFAELTASGGGIDIEHARIIFNDLLGPKHAFNLQVGRSFQTLSSFGLHSSYAADLRLMPLQLGALYGATSGSWDPTGEFNGVEVAGILGGRLDYSIGVNAGTDIDVRATENFYLHVGAKLGGLTLDGEDSQPSDPTRPWEETALTIDAFAVHHNTHAGYTNPDPTMTSPLIIGNVGLTVGGSLRGQIGSLENDFGLYYEKDNHALVDASGASALVVFDELSYIVFPWLVPSVRFEYASLNAEATNTTVTNWKLIPAVGILVRPNIKVQVAGQIESATGVPDSGNWGPINGLAVPADAKTTVTEVEAVFANLYFAF
jgi:hypothetical protein